MPNLARDRDALERRLREVFPAARLVRERYLRRAVRHLADDGLPAAFRPDIPVWIELEYAKRLEVIPDDDTGPNRVALLLGPDDRLPADRPDGEALRDYWRLLVRAAVLDRCDAAPPEALLSLAESVGPTAMREVRFVLEADRYIPAGADDVAVLRAFAAEAADRLLFAPDTLPRFFPLLVDTASLQDALQRTLGFDLSEVAVRLRPTGAAEPVSAGGEPDADWEAPADAAEAGEHLAGRAATLTRRAADAAAVGNHVRAAILRARAARLLTGPERDAVEAAARSALRDGLVARLAKVLGWAYPTARRWARALVPLLAPASGWLWPRAARALYDLQKIPADLERELFAIEPVEWLRSGGRKPVRRPMDRARNVLLLRHLGSADRHLARVRLPADDRDRLHALIRGEMHRAEERVRAELGPVIRAAVEDAGLIPRSLPERVARDKLVDELLDRACERGYLRMSDLRDAVARNQLKMPDLRGPGEFFTGDALLKADGRLGEELIGVYHRGEIYLRWIQRLTSLGFGTRAGRWLSRYFLLPFGGGVMTVEFAKYVSHEVRSIRKWLASRSAVHPATPAEAPVGGELADPAAQATEAVHEVEHEAALGPKSLTAAVLLGFLYLGLLHVPPFRVAVFASALAVWRGVRFAAIDLPVKAWQSPAVKAIRRHPLALFITRRLGSGLIAGGLTAVDMILLDYSPGAVLRWSGLAFASVAAFANTPLGRSVEDRVAESFADAWRTLRVNLIPGLIAWTLQVFRWLAGVVERCLYSVDEWLRFRAGQSEGSLAVKVALAAAWFPVAYLTRFAFYLLLEPQINPLKHFPVVTVSHKLLLPMVPGVASATGLSPETVFLIVAGIPGIFGFIAWELKENWRLYAANRPAATPPARIGHHGETMRGLLRPGFHSGTVPKLYGRIREAVRDAEATGRPAALGRWEHGLEDVAAAVAATAERELVPLLKSAACWGERTPTVGPIRVGVQTIEVSFHLTDATAPPLRMALDHADGQIAARIAEPGWAAALSPDQQAVLGNGLAGLAELFAASWAAEPALAAAAPALAAELRPRPWDHRARYWEACGATRPGDSESLALPIDAGTVDGARKGASGPRKG